MVILCYLQVIREDNINCSCVSMTNFAQITTYFKMSLLIFCCSYEPRYVICGSSSLGFLVEKQANVGKLGYGGSYNPVLRHSNIRYCLVDAFEPHPPQLKCQHLSYILVHKRLQIIRYILPILLILVFFTQ